MGTGPVLLLAGRTKKSIMDDMNDTKQVVRHVVADTFTLFYLKRWVVFFCSPFTAGQVSGRDARMPNGLL